MVMWKHEVHLHSKHEVHLHFHHLLDYAIHTDHDVTI